MTLFGAALASAGMPNHAITDTGRNGVQGLREEWGDWCNVSGVSTLNVWRDEQVADVLFFGMDRLTALALVLGRQLILVTRSPMHSSG